MKKKELTPNEKIQIKVADKLKVCKIKADYYEKLFLKWQNYENVITEAMSLYEDPYEALSYALTLMGDTVHGREMFTEVFGESFKEMFKGWEKEENKEDEEDV
jgi:hypothetical protein